MNFVAFKHLLKLFVSWLLLHSWYISVDQFPVYISSLETHTLETITRIVNLMQGTTRLLYNEKILYSPKPHLFSHIGYSQKYGLDMYNRIGGWY